MISSTFQGERLACLVQASDSAGAFIKAIVAGKGSAICEREDLSLTRFVARLEALGMDVPEMTPVRRPLDGTAAPVYSLLSVEGLSPRADSPAPT